MSSKDPIKRIEEIFKNLKGDEKLATYENIAKEFEKAPTAAQAKKIKALANKYGVQIISASEYAKYLSQKKEYEFEVRAEVS